MAEPRRHGPGGGPGPRGGFRKPKDLKGTVRKLFGYLGCYKAHLCLVVVLLILSSACTVGGSFLLKPLINDYIVPGDFPGLAKMLCVMAAVYVTGALCSFGYARIMVHVSQNTVARIRSELFGKMQKLPLKFFDTHTHGELMSRFTNDIETVAEALNNSFGSLVSNTLNFAGTILMMLVLSPALTLVTFGMMGVMLVVVKAIGGRSRRYFAAQQKTLGEVNGYIEEMIKGQKVIKVFNHEPEAKAGFNSRNTAYRDAAINAHTYAGAMMPAMGNLGYVNYALTCCIGALLAIRSGDLGGLAAFLQYSRQVSQPITQISQQMNTILSAVAGAERIFEIMETEPEVDAGKVKLVRVTEDRCGNLAEASFDTGAWAWKRAEGELVPLRGNVRFDHVVFGYDERKTVLHDISLYAKPGQKIAFVGSTGAGKTTITNLINRFYEIQSGTITGTLNGVTPAQTPNGWRRFQLSMPPPMLSLKSVFSSVGAPQAYSTISIPRVTSPLASANTLPCSRQMMCASSSWCSSSNCLNLNMTRARRRDDCSDHAGNALRAEATASSTVRWLARATRACTLPVAGLKTSLKCSLPESRTWPSR